MRWTTLSCVILVVSATGCGAEDESDFVTEWQGGEPHFLAKGTLDGEDIDVNLRDAAAADLHCEREYEVPLIDGVPDYPSGRHVETKVVGPVTIGGGERLFEIELKQHALQNDSPGDQVTIVPRVDGETPGPAEMWLEWEWHETDGADLFESAAQTGTVTLGEFIGEPDDTGLIIPEGVGSVGAFVDARWSVDQRITFSFSAPCEVNYVEEVTP